MKPAVEVTPRMKLFLSTASTEGVFGNGKWALLDAVRCSGSIATASKLLGRSYRKAWGDIQRAQQGLSLTLVETRRGGNTGGRATVTGEGARLLDAWTRYRGEVEGAMATAFDRHMRSCVAGSARRKKTRDGGA